MSHVATQLDEDALKFYECRAKELREKWGIGDCSEMLHRFLPQGHPMLPYYEI